MDKKIKYLAHYDQFKATRKRNVNMAAVNKMEYIFKTLSRLNVETTIISAATTLGKDSADGFEGEIYENVTLKLLPVMKKHNKIQKIFSKLIFWLKLISRLIKEIHKGDTLVVYHSLSLMRTVSFLKKIKKFNLILEIEEVYGDMWQNPKITEKELKFFKLADGYIFCSELLEEKINVNHKPFALIYGTYDAEEKISDRFDDGKIHCVYAGSINPRKGGALAAVELASKLPSNYVIHLLCVGINRNIMNMIQASNQKDCAKIVYEGIFKGKEYAAFLQKCHIGLSTQNSKGIFNNTSFPSKILSYFANNLRVVTAKIEVLQNCKLNDLLFYYDNDDPESIAKTIMSINFNDNYNSIDLINELNNEFEKNITNLFKYFIER